jgi:hypothetical protein
MSRIRMVLLAAPVLVLVAVLWASPAVGSADAFTGAWVATDPGDGSTLKLQIGEANASGVRHVTLMDQNQFHSGCGGLATGIGSGTVSGTTLSAALDIRCEGSLIATDVPFTFAAVGDTLVGLGVVWERAGG